MKQQTYENIYRMLCSKDIIIPPLPFIKEFLSRLNKEITIDNLDIDYELLLGKALTGEFTNVSQVVLDTQLIKWVEVYESMKEDDIDTFRESVLSILGIDDRVIEKLIENKN